MGGLLEEVEVHFVGQETPDSDIELAVVDEKRLLDVLLKHEG